MSTRSPVPNANLVFLPRYVSSPSNSLCPKVNSISITPNFSSLVVADLHEGHHHIKLDTKVISFIFNPCLSLYPRITPSFSTGSNFAMCLPLHSFSSAVASVALPQVRTSSCLTLSFVISPNWSFRVWSLFLSIHPLPCH